MLLYRFLEKNTIKRTTFPEVSKCPLQFIKITLHLVVSIVLQKHYFLAFSKKKQFAQKVKFYALQMLKKLNLTHPKAVKLATLSSWNNLPFGIEKVDGVEGFKLKLKEHTFRSP